MSISQIECNCFIQIELRYFGLIDPFDREKTSKSRARIILILFFSARIITCNSFMLGDKTALQRGHIKRSNFLTGKLKDMIFGGSPNRDS